MRATPLTRCHLTPPAPHPGARTSQLSPLSTLNALLLVVRDDRGSTQSTLQDCGEGGGAGDGQ